MLTWLHRRHPRIIEKSRETADADVLRDDAVGDRRFRHPAPRSGAVQVAADAAPATTWSIGSTTGKGVQGGSAESAPEGDEIRTPRVHADAARRRPRGADLTAGCGRGDPRRQVAGARSAPSSPSRRDDPCPGGTTSPPGLDIVDLSHVVNYDFERAGGVRPPDRPHRRAGASGTRSPSAASRKPAVATSSA